MTSMRKLTRRLRRWERYTQQVSGDPRAIYRAPSGHWRAQDRVLAERGRRGLAQLPYYRWLH
jgi:hypothetical protein